jgi:hypothetical protein
MVRGGSEKTNPIIAFKKLTFTKYEYSAASPMPPKKREKRAMGKSQVDTPYSSL